MDPNMFGNNFAGMFGQQQPQQGAGNGGMDGSNPGMGGINPAMFGGLDLSSLQNNPQLAAALLQQQQQAQQRQQQPSQLNTPQQTGFNPAMFNPAMMGLNQNNPGAGGIDMQALQRAAAAGGNNPMASFNPQLLMQQQQQLQQQQQQQRAGTPQQQQGGQQSRWPPQQQQQQPQQNQQQQMQQNLLAQLQNGGGGMFGNFGQMGGMGQPQQQQQQPQQQPQQQQQQFGAGQFNPAAFGLNPQAMALFQQNPMQAMQAMQAFGQLNPGSFPPGAFNQLMMQQQQQQQNQAGGSSQPGQPNMFQQAQNGNMQGMDASALMGNMLKQQQGQQQQQPNMFGGAAPVPGTSPIRPNSALQQQQPPNGIPSYLQSGNQNQMQPGQSSPAPTQQQPGTPQQQQQSNSNNGTVPSTPTTAAKPKPPRKKSEKKTTAKSQAQPAQAQTPVMQNANTPGNASVHQSPSASSIAGIQGASLPGSAFERSRSHTRSPSLSVGQGTPSQMHTLPPGVQAMQQQQQPQQPQPQQPPPQMGMPGQLQPGQPPQQQQQVVPPNWTPSLNPQQQQAVLSRALALAKAQEGSGLTPVHTLMQMGYLFLKASSLPGGSHPAMMPNGGMVLTINEARGLGLIPQQGGQPGAPGASPQAQQQQQMLQQQQRQMSMPGMQQQQQQPQQQGFGAPQLTPQQQQQHQQMMMMQQQQQQLQQHMQMQQQPGQPPLVAPSLGHPHSQRPTTPAGQHASPSSMRAPSPMGPAGATNSPGMGNKPRPRQPSAALSASGRPDSRSGPVPPGFQQGGPQGLMAPPPAPGHLPPGMAPGMSMPPGMVPGGPAGQMPPGFGAPGVPPMGQEATPPMLKQQGRRPSVAQDPALVATPDNRRPSMVDGRPAPPGMDGVAATTPDPMMLAAANAAAAQPSAQAQLIGSFDPAAPKGRKGSQAPQAGLGVVPPMPGAPGLPRAPGPGGEAPPHPDAAADGVAATGKPTTLAGSAPPAFAQAVPSNLANMPMLLGGPAPKESSVGTPITHFNTRVTKLDDSMRPQRAADAKGDAASSDDAKADDEVWTALTKEQEEELVSIMKRDLEYEKLYRQHQQEMEKSLKDRIDSVRPQRRKASDGTITKPKPLSWWERPEEEDMTGLHRDMFRPFGVLFPNQKRAELDQGQRGPRPHIPLKRSLMEAVSMQGEDLVPIRLEIDHEHWKLRDTFTWNAQDTHINVEAFAQSICEDIGLPTTVFVPQIKEQITTQIMDHQTTSAFKAKPTFDFSMDTKEGKGSLEDKDLRWWSKWRNKVECLPFGHRPSTDGANGVDNDAAMHVDDSSEEEGARSEPPEIVDTTPAEELRMMIKLDITVGSMNLVDQFEWDANESDPAAAEKFAETFAADLGLSGEFKTAIAHSIREQVAVHVKSLAMTGHTFDGRPIADEELRAAFLGPVSKSNLSRSELESYSFTPRLLQLTESEIERLDREREREARRKRRQTRGRRGINLPDRDPQKTQRTPAVYGIQTAQTNEAAAIQAANALSDRYGGMSTRRAAAAAANASIAPSQAMDIGTPTPGPDGLGLPDRKKPKVNHHAIHFDFPGGLGRKNDPGGPKFAPEYTEEEAKKRARSPENQATGSAAEKAAPKLVSLSYAQRNNVRPEDLERQHPNFHDGMWHCSNCGIPGTLAPGRRKGPLGDKSLCGPCGKYYHRHRKVIFLEYTRDPLFHMKQQQALNRKMGISNPLIDTALLNAKGEGEQEEGASTEVGSAADTPKGDAAGRKKGRKGDGSRSASRGGEEGGDGSDDEENDLPFEMVGSPDDSDSSSRSSSAEPTSRSRKSASQSVAPADDTPQIRRAAAERAGEKVSASFSSEAEPPAAPEVKSEEGVLPEPPPAAPIATHSSPRMASLPTAPPPDWLTESGAALKARYPNDRFEIQQRPRPAGVPPPPAPEWRVRCLDCPGKLYTPGPGESLNNFEIHLRNRLHRANVNKRVYGNEAPPSVAAAGGGSPSAPSNAPPAAQAP